MKEEVKRWIEQSKIDFSTAKYNFKGKKYYMALFLCQQSIEKSLKALWLKKNNKEVPKTHDLMYFAKKLDLPENFNTVLEDLSSIYLESRYPDMSIKIPGKKFSKEEAKNFIQETDKILRWIKKNL